MSELKIEEKIIDPDSQELYKSYKSLRSRRDLMGHDHFEIIDERIFLECSVYRILIDQIKEKRIEDELKMQQIEEEKKQAEIIKNQTPESNDLSFGEMECSDVYTRQMIKERKNEKKQGKS